MIIERTLFIFYVTATIQITCPFVSGEKESNCSTHGNPCFQNDPKPCCSSFLECIHLGPNHYQCECQRDYEWNDGQCQFGETCSTNTDCERKKFSECSERRLCSCKTDYIKKDPYTCQGLIGAACSKNHDCFPHNSICLDGFCKCKCNYLSVDSDLCNPTFFELTCLAGDDRCQDEEINGCVHGKCHCHVNHVVVDSTCRPLLNESCGKNGLCAIKHSICDNEVCQCKSDYKSLSNDHCLPTKLYQRCQRDGDCRFLRSSKCSIFEFCECFYNYIQINETTCAVRIGGKCSSNADCIIENSICFQGFCKCKNSYTNYVDEKCITGLHKYCKTDINCAEGKFTICSENNTCECEPNYIASEEDMVCLPSLYGICDRDDDCISENSYCSYNRCQCKKFYFSTVTDGIYTCTPLLLGHACSKNSDCKISEHFICSSDGRCACPGNYYASEDKRLCLPKIGGPCSKNEDCGFENSHCINEECQCNPYSSAVSENECVLKSSTVYCDQDIQCGEPWHAVCSPDHNCICKANNTLVNKSTCSPLLGGLCLKDDQCMVKNSVCEDFHCRCKSPDFKPVANNLCMM